MATVVPVGNGEVKAEPRGTTAAWYALGVLVVITLFGYVDRQVFILLAEPIKRELLLSDTQLGLLQGIGIALFGAAAAYPIGWLSDRFDRRWVLAGCVLVWSLAVVGCALAPSFAPLLLASAMVGVGEAGLVPIVYTLIPELFRDRARMTANAIYSVATSLGFGLASAACAGIVIGIPSLRPWLPAALAGLTDWRLAFIVAAAPAPFMIALLATIRAARPTGSTASILPQLSDGSTTTFTQHLVANRRSISGFFLGYGLAAFGFASTINWVPVIVMRLHGVGVAEAGSVTGSITLGATLIGFVLGLVLIRVLAPRMGSRFPVFAIWTAIAAAAATCVALPFTTSAGQIYALQGLEYVLIMGAFMVFPTAMQDLAPDHLRGRVFALGNVFRLICLAGSPIVVGAISDLLGSRTDAILIAAASSSALSLGLSAWFFWWSDGGQRRAIDVADPR